MSNQKISDLPDDTTVTLADYVPIVTPGSTQTKKASLARVIALAGSGSGSGIGGGSPTFLDSFVVNLPDNQSGIPNGTTVNAGDSIATFLESAFRKASPAVYNYPSASLSGSPAPAAVEVGTALSIAFSIGFTQNDAGAQTSLVLNKNGSPLTATSGTYTDSITATLSPVNYQAIINYAQGHINNDSLGSPDASGRIAAGSVSSNVLSYQGFYLLWYDAVATIPAASAAVRALSNARFSNAGNSFTLNTGSTQTHFVLVLPPGKSLVSVIDQDALNLDITSQYAATGISVNNASGTAVSGYTLYSMSQSVPYSSNHRHNITIA
jgi:hypothetical protein